MGGGGGIWGTSGGMALDSCIDDSLTFRREGSVARSHAGQPVHLEVET